MTTEKSINSRLSVSSPPTSLGHASHAASGAVCASCPLTEKTQHWRSSPKLIFSLSSNALHFPIILRNADSDGRLQTILIDRGLSSYDVSILFRTLFRI